MCRERGVEHLGLCKDKGSDARAQLRSWLQPAFKLEAELVSSQKAHVPTACSSTALNNAVSRIACVLQTSAAWLAARTPGCVHL